MNNVKSKMKNMGNVGRLGRVGKQTRLVVDSFLTFPHNFFDVHLFVCWELTFLY